MAAVYRAQRINGEAVYGDGVSGSNTIAVPAADLALVGFAPTVSNGGTVELVGRRRRTRTYKAPIEQPSEEPALDVAPKLAPPTTTLMPDAQHIVVASVSKAERLAKSATVKRRMAIELADEQALDALLMTYF